MFDSVAFSTIWHSLVHELANDTPSYAEKRRRVQEVHRTYPDRKRALNAVDYCLVKPRVHLLNS